MKFEIKNSHLNTLIFVVIILIILKNFGNIQYPAYGLNYLFYTNKDFFSESFLNSSIFFKNPFYYELFKFLNFDLDNTINQFLLHVILKIVSLIFLFLIIKNFIHSDNNYLTFLCIIILSTKDGLVIDGTQSSWVFNHNTNPSDLGFTLNLAILYFILKRKIFWLVLLTVVALLNSIKSSWFISLIVMSSILLDEKGIKKNFFFIIPVTLIYLTTKDFILLPNHNDKYELFKYAYNRENNWTSSCEATFDCKNPLRVFILIISFIFFFFVNKKTKNIKFKNTLNLILFFSVSTFLFYKLLDFLDLKTFKFWQIVALSPVRALAIYELCFFLLITLNLLKLKSNFYNLLILLSFTFFGWGKIGYIISFCFILIFIIFYYFNLSKNMIFKKKKFIFFFFLLTIPSFFYLMVNSFIKDKKINLNYFVLEKNFFYNFSEDHYYALKKIQPCKDFKFEDFTNRFDSRIKSNLLAKKSPFVYDPVHFYGNINLLEINKKNTYLLNELYSNYQNNIQINLNKLNIFNLVLLVPNEKENLFLGNNQKIKINNKFTLILANKENLLIEECFR